MTTTSERAETTVGFGRRSRKEDPRFLRGRGQYLDDITLPGMLHGAILRSPYAHARIVSIDTSQAEAHPKVRAVITGALLETLNLAWIPSLSHDVIAVLATDKVRYQGQEVAFVVTQDLLYPRVHPAPLETCGSIADMDKVTGKLTIWCTTQAPHAHRTLYALVAGLPEQKIRVVSPDI